MSETQLQASIKGRRSSTWGKGLDTHAICKAYLGGERVADIAIRLGCSTPTVYWHLDKGMGRSVRAKSRPKETVASETSRYNPIKKALELAGHTVTRVHSGKVKVKGGWMQLADEGTPDHVVTSPNGLTTWLETKTESGKLSPAQVAWHERAKKGGHRVAVVRSVAEALAAVSR